MAWRAHEITPEVAGEEIARALNLFVGQGKRYSVEELSAAIAVEPKTIENWKRGKGLNAANLFKLITFFAEDHPEFGLAVLRETGLLSQKSESEIRALQAIRRVLPELVAAVEDLDGEGER
jgi:hypothetical protein